MQSDDAIHIKLTKRLNSLFTEFFYAVRQATTKILD